MVVNIQRIKSSKAALDGGPCDMLVSVVLGNCVNVFPFKMFVNEFGVATYEEFLAAK